jgi:hypothetical protein
MFNPKVDSFKDLKLHKGGESFRSVSGSTSTIGGAASPGGAEVSPAASPAACLETGGPAVPPLYTVQGVRDYTCSLCPGVRFHLLEGPNSVKEHLAQLHSGI